MGAPLPGNEAAYIHYLTMLHWHNDGKRVGTLLTTLFFIVAGFDLVMFIATESHVFAFTAVFATIVAITGAFLVRHHGRKADRWAKRLKQVTQ